MHDPVRDMNRIASRLLPLADSLFDLPTACLKRAEDASRIGRRLDREGLAGRNVALFGDYCAILAGEPALDSETRREAERGNHLAEFSEAIAA